RLSPRELDDTDAEVFERIRRPESGTLRRQPVVRQVLPRDLGPRAPRRTYRWQVFGLAGVAGAARRNSYRPSLPGSHPVLLTAVVPAHRCGAVPDSRRVPSCLVRAGGGRVVMGHGRTTSTIRLVVVSSITSPHGSSEGTCEGLARVRHGARRRLSRPSGGAGDVDHNDPSVRRAPRDPDRTPWRPARVAGGCQSQSRVEPDWYSITLVSKKFFSFCRSIASDIHGNGLSTSANTGRSPSWSHRRLVMKCMYCAHSSALSPRMPRGMVSRP